MGGAEVAAMTLDVRIDEIIGADTVEQQLRERERESPNGPWRRRGGRFRNRSVDNVDPFTRAQRINDSHADH